MKMKSSKRQKQQKNLKSWISKHEFHGTTKGNINDYIGQRYEADEDVYVETLIPDLPSELQSDVKRHICLDLLKNIYIQTIFHKVGLQHRRQWVAMALFFNEHHYIVREGDPIDAVFLITEGIVWTCTSNNGEGSGPRHAERLEKGQYFGGKLLEWVLTPTSDDMYNLSKLPISSKTLKTHTKVEAFALMAHDLKQIWQSKLSRLGQEQLQSKAAARVQRIWRRNHPKTDDSNSIGGGSRKL
uniref:Cyclic nucleotide-binding domain-containing protein n=1 Tax=Quercus lobata TaxID=97700 RepID=A0A7N2MVN0_QUELO